MGKPFPLHRRRQRDQKQSNEEYGAKRLEELLRNADQRSAQGLIDLVMKDLQEYSGFSTLEDDCTMLMLKRK